MFDEAKCDLCGDCLTGCAYVDYSQAQAVAEIAALIAGEAAGVLTACVTCMACNEYCEKGAQPFDLISSRQEQTQALPVPDQTLAFFDQIHKMPSQVLPGSDKKKILSLCAVEPALSPAHIVHPMFAGLTVVKGGDYFCHIAKLHLARPGAMEAAGRKFMRTLRGLCADEIVFFHDECYTMVHKMVQEFGERLPFKATHLLAHINDYLRQYPGVMPRQGLKIAYQRPCSSRLGPDTEKMLDAFFSLTGVTRVNRKYDRKHALCCGSALLGLGHIDAAHQYQAKNILDAKANGAEAIIYLCPMCGGSLAATCHEHELECLSVMELVPIE